VLHGRYRAELFEKDNSDLWGISLAGPVIFADPDSRIAVANQADSQNTLTPVDGVFSGRLPSNLMIANTAIDWNQTKWTMVLWPLPEDPDERKIVLAHEAWHRVQDKVGFPSSGAMNEHLNSLDGRFLLQLEWRALSQALQNNKADRIANISDALHFRFCRHQLLNGSEEQERAMEMHEGLAEYTGVRMALEPAKRVSRTVFLLDRRPSEMPTFVRSFAYLSGPAYGLLLDDLDADWLKNLTATTDLGKLLREASGIDLESDLANAVAERSRKYDGETLWNVEKKRDDERTAFVERLTERFVTGPRLILPLEKSSMSFDPNELMPLGEEGTVYPTLTITDQWGVLTVTGGALISKDFKQVHVNVPDGYSGALKTSDWELVLNQGWTIELSDDQMFRVSFN
jgi:hypothetical protein